MKKKNLFYVLLSVPAILLLLSDIAVAQEEKLSFSLTQKNDWVAPENKDAYFSTATVGYAQRGKIGFWFDVKVEPDKDSLRFRPTLVYKEGPLYLVGGVSTDNLGQDYFQTGIWLIKAWNNFSINLDIRNYFQVSGKASSYLDNLFEITYPLTGNLSVGLSGDYLHWWNINREELLLGPIVYYKISRDLTVFLRYAEDWRWEGGRTQPTSIIRLGIKYSF